MVDYRRVAAPILAIFFVQVASALINAFLPLSLHQSGAPVAFVGIVGAIYGAGFMAGAAFSTRIIRRIGHIRAFAGAAGLGAVSTIILIWAYRDPFSAGLARLMAGTSVAILFAAAESWINDGAPAEARGRVISVYMALTKTALVLGPFLPLLAGDAALTSFAMAGMFFALALLPMTATSNTEPPTPNAEPFGIDRLWEIAPASLVAAFTAGVLNVGIVWHASIFAGNLSDGPVSGPVAAAFFLAAGYLGSFLVTWPAGVLSDRLDRRSVIAGLGAIAAASSVLLFLIGLGKGPFWPALVVYFFWGAGALSFYGVGVAHAADRADRRQMAQVISGLLFVWAGGSIAGPFLLGLAAQIPPFGIANIFLLAALGYGGMAFTMVVRRAQRPQLATDNKEPYVAAPTTSVVIAEADPRAQAATGTPAPG